MDKKNTWISLRTKDNISSNETYEIHILALNGANHERIDINIQDGRAYYEKYSNYSYYSGEPELQIRDNGLILEIPSSAFNNVNSFMINADLIDGYPQVDWIETR